VRTRVGAGIVIVISLALAGCGSKAEVTGSVRMVPVILRCFRQERISAGTVALVHLKSPTGLAAPWGLVVIDDGSSLSGEIAVYGDRVTAASVFARQGPTAADMLDGNAILQLPSVPLPPSSATVKELERCAFGARADPRRSSYYVASYAQPLTGHAVMLRSGCLACHQIGTAGNRGPGPNLTDVGSRLSPAAIANALADPAAPMPSFQEIEHSDPIAWRALVAYLARLRTG
jgi:mono/diheme cytochrome c family protein